ncbi:precorrin-6y C5,15-methyltransferase (decarboxylating), CbiE subunit [Geobacter metallireducens RCH3]|uniref:Cobalt-precorrin-6B C5,C15-methyltransferase and C12-decarboxylase n=1 Tax=Geobacter metallireducens (strain ATCC 53774 / DSM 7210 / GS-15) TaxID=269799 RepID=Q39YF0_GEOMG|nr:bifunctional cobalt-precorrin-7 (C(5))-methyltransferase/cobalt-precorrin-6B (C(15))-methyltransferase [Geobacter metallireducens]ABB30724.1 cobalt-precorrin-6B C5,C15-methyltransferase and C12-decarboxylase [Geobacter metallireducens GS-15]EHP85531.1 precorrin-6y C5,15-methyltransferase (decarboxylating), CbiE subunit [Geobacter metallireducens RCH3]
MPHQKIYLVGAGIEGWEGFGAKALEVIGKAEVLVGHKRHLDIFSDFTGKKQELGDLSILLEQLRSTDKRTVVLGSGDPNFFGIARFLLRNLPKERIEIFPNVTSVQYAFAQIKEPWDDAIFVSVHGRGLKGAVDRIVAAEKVAVLTDKTNSPAAIARELIARGAEGYEAWLCENLGLPGEKFTRTDVKGLLELPAAELNILILIKAWEPQLAQYPVIGIDDDEFATAKKLITKQEVRAVTLSKLRLQDDLVMWDIGAGSASVSIEASNLMPNGRIFALERNPQYLGFIRDNLKKFVARNVTLVEAFAPEGLDDLPDPDRVFIGGSGGMLEEIIDAVDRRLKSEGVIVLNAVTLDTLTKAVEFLEDHGYMVEVACVNVAKTKGLTEYKMFESHNPVYIITAWKSDE